MSTSQQAEPASTARVQAALPGRRRQRARSRQRVRRLTRRDKVVLGRHGGHPHADPAGADLDPHACCPSGCRFTRWNGLALTDIKPAGADNYHFISQDYPPFWPAVQHNVLWLLFLAVVGHPAGPAAGGAAGPADPRQPDLPEHLLHSGDAVAGAGRHHLAAVLPARQRPAELPARHRRHAAGRRLVRRLQREHLGRHDRRHLAARRLRHDPVPGRAEGRRPQPEGGGGHRRRQRRPDLLPRGLPGHAARSTSSSSSSPSSSRCGPSTSST